MHEYEVWMFENYKIQAKYVLSLASFSVTKYILYLLVHFIRPIQMKLGSVI